MRTICNLNSKDNLPCSEISTAIDSQPFLIFCITRITVPLCDLCFFFKVRLPLRHRRHRRLLAVQASTHVSFSSRRKILSLEVLTVIVVMDLFKIFLQVPKR